MHCAAQLRLHRAMRDMMAKADLHFAPPGRHTHQAMLPAAAAAAPAGIRCSRALCSISFRPQPRQALL